MIASTEESSERIVGIVLAILKSRLDIGGPDYPVHPVLHSLVENIMKVLEAPINLDMGFEGDDDHCFYLLFVHCLLVTMSGLLGTSLNGFDDSDLTPIMKKALGKIKDMDKVSRTIRISLVEED